MKTIGQSFEYIVQLAPACRLVGCDQLIIRAADVLVKFDVRRAPQTAALSVLMKDAADKQRIIAGMRAKQKRLLGSGSFQCDEQIGNDTAARGYRCRPSRANDWPAKKFPKASRHNRTVCDR